MIITDIKAVYPTRKNRFLGIWQEYYWQIVVRVETNRGIIGYGYGGGGDPGRLIVNGHFRDLLIGRAVDDISDIKRIWDYLYLKSLPYGQAGITIMALSGIDLALWDLLGKAEKKPVYSLIGGLKKEKVRAYATGGNPSQVSDLGYTALKFSHEWQSESDYETAIASAERFRNLFGKDALLMFDCYMSWDATVAIRMRELLAIYEPYWFEDLLTPNHLEDLANLRVKISPILLAGGEHNFSHHAFGAIAKAGALDIWQPDITWCGGITAGLRIVELARVNNVPVCPHRGGEIWGLHLVVATDCLDLAETHPARMEEPSGIIWLNEPVVSAGSIMVGDQPGFGVTPREDYF